MSKCLGCDISVRKHSKSEHWAPSLVTCKLKSNKLKLLYQLSPDSNGVFCQRDIVSFISSSVLLNKVVAMPYMVKKNKKKKKKHLKIFFSRTKKALRLNLDILHPGHYKVYQVCWNDDLWPFLRHCQISVLVAMVILEVCCMASADMQCHFYSGDCGP